MKPLRVLLISHTCQSRSEGQPRAHFVACAPDIELCVLVPSRWKRYGAWRTAQPPIQPNYEFISQRTAWAWSGPGQTYLHWYPGLPRLLKRFAPDVIDVWEEPWSLLAAQVCFWRDRWLPNCKIVIETEQNIEKKLPPPFGFFRSHVLRRADFVVARSAQALEIARRGGYSGRGSVVPNAVDTALFNPAGAVESPFGAESFVVGYVGRLTPAKGIEELLRAVAVGYEKVKLVLVGAGPEEAGFRALSQQLGLENRVSFVGMRPSEELPALMRGFDVLVLPLRTTSNWKEQFGRVLIEAGACGVPVIGSDSGAIPGVIGCGDDAMGLIFPEGDARALSGAIEEVRTGPDRAQRWSQNGVRRAHEQFSWQQIAARMVEIYREVSA